jgi:hypothetical protein
LNSRFSSIKGDSHRVESRIILKDYSIQRERRFILCMDNVAPVRRHMDIPQSPILPKKGSTFR